MDAVRFGPTPLVFLWSNEMFVTRKVMVYSFLKGREQLKKDGLVLVLAYR
jgi:hypothetical protein